MMEAFVDESLYAANQSAQAYQSQVKPLPLYK
jgi:hypothetical protein